MYVNFQQNRINRAVITVHTNLFAKNRKLHKFAANNSNFLKSTLSDMHHRKTHMYINFQQNRVSTSVKTVHINLFAKNCKLHKFATCIFLKVTPFGHAPPHNRHSGQIWDQSAKKLLTQTDGRTDIGTDRRRVRQ